MAKIMVVEDSNLMISVIKNFIRKSGKDHEVIEASDGQEAVDKFIRKLRADEIRPY